MTENLIASSGEAVRSVDLGISDELNRVVRSIVRNKYILDNAVADHGAAMLARDLHDGGYGPHEPMPFLHRILPFAYAIERDSEYQLATVPTANTIGCSWAWRRKNLSEDETLRRRKLLDNPSALVAGTLNNASYSWIKQLGLFAPGEGKNRVDFFREEGIDSIPAKVYERAYPEPNRIVIYSVKKNGFSATWAVLDGRWVESVQNPSWTLPLMNAYGVKTNSTWPREFPAPEKVQLAFFESRGVTSPFGNPEFGNAHVVDLDTIRAILAFQDEPEKATIHDLQLVKIDPRVWKYSLAVSLPSCALLVALPNAWAEARIIAGIVFGMAACTGLLPYVAPIITTPRHGLAKKQYLPLERAPKYGKRTGRRMLG